MKKEYKITNGDCIIEMENLAKQGIQFDLSIFSPPFASLYAYTGEAGDMGNSKDSDNEFMLHYQFFARRIYPLIKSGRNVVTHVMNPVRTKNTHGYMGIWDMRGEMIRVFESAGFNYYGEVTIEKNPQAQAIRTKAHTLMFKTLDKDSSINRPALADYLLIFKKPGDNKIQIKPDVTRNEWIEWANPIWHTIHETNTLSTIDGKTDQDEKHICPLQIDLIERVVRLWSNKGETVFSPFAGIGSEGYISLALNRKFHGIEIKKSYYNEALRNFERAIIKREGFNNQQNLLKEDSRLTFQYKSKQTR